MLIESASRPCYSLAYTGRKELMPLPSRDAVEADVLCVAETYSSDLAWLAAFHEVVKCYQKRAEFIDRDANSPPGLKDLMPLPERVLRQPLPPTYPAGTIRQRFERTFCKKAKGFSSDDFGHYLNKMAVVYAAAILEAFLEEVYEARTGGASIKPRPNRSATVTTYIKRIGDQNQKLPQPPPSGLDHIWVPDFEWCASQVLQLDDLRHKVVHDHGSARVDLAVDTVVMPHLEDAIAFVDEATRRLLCDARPR